jgi:predicted outer membrane repeat protein
MNSSANVSGNTADFGGGVFVNMGTFTMNGSASMSGNTANGGGGVQMYGGTFTMNGSASVSGNTAIDSGGGVLMHDGTFHIQSGTVTGNKSYNGFAPNKAGTSTTGTGVSLYVQPQPIPPGFPVALWGTAGTNLTADGTVVPGVGYYIDDAITGTGVKQ